MRGLNIAINAIAVDLILCAPMPTPSHHPDRIAIVSLRPGYLALPHAALRLKVVTEGYVRF